MPDDTLTLDSALALMTVKPEDNNPPAAAAASADPAPATAPEDNAAPAQPAQAVDDADPDADPNSPSDAENTNASQADPGDALPPIEPPASLTTEEKAEWNSLSRKAQEIIQRREQDNTRALRNAQNSTAESNKKAEAEVARLKAISDRMDGYLNEKVADLAREFPEIKSEADLVALAQSDPAKYTAFQAKLQALAVANAAKADAQRELTQKATEKQQLDQAAAKENLIKAFPAWTDPEVARREVTELQDYAIKALGVPESTARATIDPVVYKLAQKAMLYDRAQEKATAAIKRDPPRVVPPAAKNSNPNADAKAETRRSQLEKLSKTGDLEDALGLLRA